MRRSGRENQPGFWPGVSDTLLGALMMVLLLALGGLMLYALRPRPAELPSLKVAVLQEQIASLQKEVKTLRDRINLLEDHIKILQGENADLKVHNKMLTDENVALKRRINELEEEVVTKDAIIATTAKKDPPIIQFTDVQTISFDSGEARLSEDFKADLEKTHFNSFVTTLEEYPVVDTIEIIGHTDRKEVSHTSTLDKNLDLVLQGGRMAEMISPGSNADLGLMRSLAVWQCWDSWLKKQALAPGSRARDIQVRVYSAACAVLPGTPPSPYDGSPESKKANDEFDKSARRIEIRFTKLKREIAKP